MKTSRIALAGTAVSLLLTSLPLTAGELPFDAPATTRATESALLLHQTAQALYDLPSGTSLHSSSGQHISNLWLFPTADADTVFARYNLTSNDQPASSPAAAGTEHLTVLTVRGNHILESRDLTSTQVELAANAPPTLHWSAAIGTGHAASTLAASTPAASPSKGKPASPHWTAKIGTGAAASTATSPDSQQHSPSNTHPSAAVPNWTSKIGTGHAVDSTAPTSLATAEHVGG